MNFKIPSNSKQTILPDSLASILNRYQLLLFVISVTLVSISLFLTPTIDYISHLSPAEYPLFYASRLPITYYFAIPILALLVLSPNKSIRLVSCSMLALLVEFTPSLMLRNPWIPDQYPFLSEVFWLKENHFIANSHYLRETPGLGLMFSQLAVVCDFDPFQISKIFPLLTIFSLIFIFTLVEKLGGNGGLGVFLFLSFNVWFNINVFHRQFFSFMLFLLLMYVLIGISKSRGRSFFISYLITFSAIVISHPGTTSFTIIALGLCVLGVYVSRIKQDLRYLYILIISFSLFYLWHYYISGDFMKFFSYAWESLMNFFLDIANPPGMLYLGLNYTDTFRVIFNIRILFTIGYLLLAILSSFYILFFRRGKRGLMLIAFSFVGFALEFLAYVYLAPWGRLRPLLFLVYASAIPISLVLSINISSHQSKHRYHVISTIEHFICKNRQKMLVPIVIFAIVLSVLVPVLRYSGIPYLHPSTQELYSKTFISHFYFSPDRLMVTESNLAYELDEVFLDRPILPLEPINVPTQSIDETANYWIINRFLTRDGYYIFSPSYRDFLVELNNTLPYTHNLVYMNDRYGVIFIARKS